MKFFVNKHYHDDLLSNGKSILNERKSSRAMKLPGHKFCEAIYSLCTKIATGDLTSLKATTLRTMVRNEFPRSEQHDANEFILYLFSKLQDEQTPKFAKFVSDYYEDGIKAWKGYEAQHQSIIDKLFTGMSQTNIRCGKCKNVSVVYDCFNHIHLS